MPKVSVIILPYHKTKLIKPVFDAIFAQTHKDLEAIAVINDSNDGSKEIIRLEYPQVKIIESGWNAWFAAGNNLGIKNSNGEFIQLVNDDLLLEPDYIASLLKGFEDPKVAAATGKILRFDFEGNKKTNIIDSTGVTISSSGRGRDRGQLEEDKGQFDHLPEVFGVSGAAPMYRRSALEKVKYCERTINFATAQNVVNSEKTRCEYFDEDFVAYWEDVDLSWRLNRAGFRNIYAPRGVAYHGRTAGQSKGGYFHLWHFISHHKKVPPMIRQLNYKNHILMYLKNARFILHPAFIMREIAMLGYVLVFEPSTLKVVPQLFRQLPGILKKRGSFKR